MTSENTAPVSERGGWPAWLIERGGQWYAAAPHSRWTTQQAIDASTWRENWTSDANKALRFARKCDAETLIRYESLQNAVATEHVWLEREEWPDLRDPRNIRRALRQAQDNLERAAASPAPGDDFTPDGNCRAVEAARQIAALQGSEGGHAGKLESAPTGGAAHLLGGERRFEHELKTWPRYFDALVDATKTFEVRQNDRAFEVGDTLWLREYRPGFGEGVYTGRELRRRVTYILHGGEFGIAAGHVVMGLATLPEPPSPTKQAPEAPPVTAERSSPHEQNTPSPPDTPEAIGDEVVEALGRVEMYLQLLSARLADKVVTLEDGTRFQAAAYIYAGEIEPVLAEFAKVRAALSALHQAGKLPATGGER